MISLPEGANIWLAAGVADIGCGFTGLSAVVQTALQQNPYEGHVFVFLAAILPADMLAGRAEILAHT